MVAGILREHIPVNQLRGGEVVFVVPRDATTPRAPKLGPIPEGGSDLAVTEYILGCAQRGAVICYGRTPESAPAPAGGE